MRTRIAALALLLAAQLALAAYLGFGRTGAPPATAALSLPAAEAVETITIAAAADEPAADRNPDDQPAPAEPVSLLRREGRWALAEPAGLPADAARVDSLLTKLAGLRPGLPVADSKAARRRFAVADDHYERRITLQTADGEQVLYLGTPAGTRRTHLRTAGDEAIHLVPLALYEVPADADGWLDKTLLQLPAETIEAIDVAGLRLTRAAPPAESANAQQGAEPDAAGAGESDGPAPAAGRDAAAPQQAASAGGGTPDTADTAAKADEATAGREGPAAEAGHWAGSGPGGPVAVSAAAVDDLARRIAGLRVAGLAHQAPPGEAVRRFSVTRSDGSERTYRLFALSGAGEAASSDPRQAAPATDTDYLLTVSDRPQIFRVPAFLADPLREAASRQQLLATGSGKDAQAEDKPAAP